ncbi:MAG: NAD(P)H-dependent oxidoreductase [Planctomycetota bacterium]|nr:NAD(P)H-dependent oxidoreductase [Planctomycetota bacterium]
MTKILYLEASPRGERSASCAVAKAFIEAYREAHPDVAVAPLNLFAAEMPAFGREAAQGKYAIMRGEAAPAKAKAAFQKIVRIINAFKEHDLYVFAVPMWNFGIPYPLKHYLDLLVQPTYTFEVTADGYRGLLSGKRAFCAFARGGDYRAAEGMDFQKRYLEMILRFIGIEDVQSVVIQPTIAGGEEVVSQRLEEAKVQARRLAKEM